VEQVRLLGQRSPALESGGAVSPARNGMSQHYRAVSVAITTRPEDPACSDSSSDSRPRWANSREVCLFELLLATVVVTGLSVLAMPGPWAQALRPSSWRVLSPSCHASF